MPSPRTARLRSLVLLSAALFAAMPACTGSADDPAPAAGEEARPTAGDAASTMGAAEHAALAPWRAELLDLAYEGVSRFPLEPHIKNRSRAQEVLVRAAFDLGDAERALGYGEGIANWRRGAALAEYAVVAARAGRDEQARASIDRAVAVLASSEDAQAQEWRRDTIRVQVSKAWHLLGEAEKSAEYETDLVPSQWGKVAVLRAETMPREDVPAELDYIDQVFGLKQFDQSRTMLELSAVLFDRFYDDRELHDAILEVTASAPRAVSAQVMIEAWIALADVALAHADPTGALALVERAEEVLEAKDWLPQDQVPLMGALAGRRGQAGDLTVARRKLDAALLLYEQNRDAITDIDRAGALRPVAEAYARLGECPRALEVYARAVEEGVANPNSRPRADDLAATCSSLARGDCPPDAALLARLHEVGDGLGDPW